MEVWVYRRQRCACLPQPVCVHSLMKCCLMSSDVSWHIRDKLRPMPKHSFATTTFAKTETLQRVGIRAKNNYQWKKEKTSGLIYISTMAVFARKLWLKTRSKNIRTFDFLESWLGSCRKLYHRKAEFFHYQTRTVFSCDLNYTRQGGPEK